MAKSTRKRFGKANQKKRPACDLGQQRVLQALKTRMGDSSFKWTRCSMPSKIRLNLPQAIALFFQEMYFYMSHPTKEIEMMVNDTTTYYGLGEVKPSNVEASLEVITYLAKKKNHQFTVDVFITVAEHIYHVNQECFDLGHSDLNYLNTDDRNATINFRQSIEAMGFASTPSLIAKYAEALIFSTPWPLGFYA
jgi:hypothetical protein